MDTKEHLVENQTAQDGDSVETRQLPMATICVLSITAIITSLQFVSPAIVSALQRDPAALAGGEWWRLITPLLVHPDGWPQIIVDFAGIAIVGPVVERRFENARWLALYFGAGLSAEIISYAWEPSGAGSSIALCGLIGGLFADLIGRHRLVWPVALMYALGLVAALVGLDLGGPIAAAISSVLAGSLLGLLLRRDKPEAASARIVGIAGLLGALVLTALRNHHGPPILVGAGLAALFWRQSSSTCTQASGSTTQDTKRIEP
jgi:membrane associated rhomboid family serine protease